MRDGFREHGFQVVTAGTLAEGRSRALLGQFTVIVLDVLLGECLPMNGSFASSTGLYRTHTLTSSQAAQFMPLLGEWRGTPNPTVLLTTRRGEVGGFDLYSSSSNYNAVLVAESGAGKSFWTQRLIGD